MAAVKYRMFLMSWERLLNRVGSEMMKEIDSSHLGMLYLR